VRTPAPTRKMLLVQNKHRLIRLTRTGDFFRPCGNGSQYGFWRRFGRRDVGGPSCDVRS